MIAANAWRNRGHARTCGLLLLSFLAGARTPLAHPTNGLVAHWQFNEGSGDIVVDSSGRGHDATRYGAAWVDGYVRSGMRFDGTDDYVEAPGHPDFNCGGGHASTSIGLAAWVKAHDLSRTTFEIAKQDPSACNYAFMLASTNLVFHFWVPFS